MDTCTVRKIILTSLFVSLVACGPAEQGAEQEAGGAPEEIIALEGTNWQLIRLTVLGGFVFTADDPSKYVLNFRSENRLTGDSDCNSITGTWLQDEAALRFEPFSTSRKLCSPGSLHNNWILNLKDTTAFEFRAGHLFLSTMTEDIEMEFESRDM